MGRWHGPVGPFRFVRARMSAFTSGAANVVLGGHPDETISSRVGKAALRGGWFALACERLIDWLFLNLAGERDHCRDSIEWDEV